MKTKLSPLLVLVVIANSLCSAQDPVLWGMTPFGGVNNNGIIFSFNAITASETVQQNFDDTDGESSFGSLILANNGLLYGMSHNGGTGNAGVLFSYNMSTGSESILHNFLDDSNDGFYPEGSLIQGRNGLLYGLAQDGGNLGGGGVIFSFDIATDSETILHSFGGMGTGDGRLPTSSLMQANNGLLYGTTPYGGTHNSGTIFSYNILTDSESVLYSFDNDTDGLLPGSSLVQAGDSLLYGTAEMGGANNKGIIYSYNTTTGIYHKVYDFGGNGDGTYPNCTFLNASNGLLYGLTTEAGANGFGVIFSYNISTGNETVLYSFAGDSDGASPAGSLMQASNGLLYGMTTQGGGSDGGTIISYDIQTGREAVVNRFNGTTTGEFQIGGTNGDLIQVNIPTAIRPISLSINTIQIYPNPNKGNFTLMFSDDFVRDVEITDAVGRVIMASTPVSRQQNFNLESFSAGIYIVRISQQGQVQSLKFALAR